MTDIPRIGEESESWRVGLCAYSDAPGEPHCTRDATWHGIKMSEPEWVAMASCDAHLPIMLTLADCAHPLVHPCDIPDAEFRWPENRCFLEWDESAEFAAEAMKAVP